MLITFILIDPLTFRFDTFRYVRLFFCCGVAFSCCSNRKFIHSFTIMNSSRGGCYALISFIHYIYDLPSQQRENQNNGHHSNSYFIRLPTGTSKWRRQCRRRHHPHPCHTTRIVVRSSSSWTDRQICSV